MYLLLVALPCPCLLSCCLILLLYSSVVLSWCVSDAHRGMLCVVSSYIVLSVVVSPAVGCTRSLVLSVVYRSRSCLLGCSCRLSCRLSCRACPYGLVTSLLAVATTAPRGYPQAARYPTLRRGGAIFQKGGRGRPKPTPSPFLCARSKKMWFFSAKTWEMGRI